jgi:hypothetical protein
MSFIRKYHLVIFFTGFFLLNLFQAAYTELLDDEAYYWVYSKFPDWGYYDHPPVIALLIRAGGFLFPNELGVRFFIVVLNTLTLLIIYKLLPRKDDRLFYAMASSIAVLQAGGIIAVPDLPLCFFVALFFLVYREFLKSMSIGHTLLLGAVMALMLYSKYHGVLIIFFTLMSNWKLLTKYQSYLAAFTGLVLFLPHLYWQYVNGYPSLYYHLLERNAPAYKFSFTVEYIVGQVLLAGPLIGWMLLWAALRYQTKDPFERALKFSMIGFYVFFLLSSLRGRVEANWTVPALVPLFILSHQYLQEKLKWQRLLIKLVPITLIIILFARVYLVFDTSTVKALRKDEFHQNRLWAEKVREITHGLPVVFTKSYQDPSKYWFYTGIPSFCLNTPDYRRNNYNFWPIEDSLYNKKVAVISWKDYPYPKDSILTPEGLFIGFVVDSFYSFSKVKITSPRKAEVINGKLARFPLSFFVTDDHLKAFKEPRIKDRRIELHIIKENELVKRFLLDIPVAAINQKEQTITTDINIDLPPGIHQGKLVMPSCLEMDPSLNSPIVMLEVK